MAMAIDFHDVCPGAINLPPSHTITGAKTRLDAQSCHQWATGELRRRAAASVHTFDVFHFANIRLPIEMERQLKYAFETISR